MTIRLEWNLAVQTMKGSKNMERVYKTMRNTGAGCIAVGIIIAVTGLAVGIISIVNGALLLKRKSEIAVTIRQTTPRQKAGWVLFILYLCLLAYFMFFSESFGRTETDREYAYNLVLFKEIGRYFRYYEVLGFGLFMINIVGNIAAFIPFGFFLPIISKRSRLWYNTVMFGFIWSLMLETLQLILRVGSFDVDDMFLNTLGAGIGFYIHGIAHYVRVLIHYRRWKR